MNKIAKIGLIVVISILLIGCKKNEPIEDVSETVIPTQPVVEENTDKIVDNNAENLDIPIEENLEEPVEEEVTEDKDIVTREDLKDKLLDNNDTDDIEIPSKEAIEDSTDKKEGKKSEDTKNKATPTKTPSKTNTPTAKPTPKPTAKPTPKPTPKPTAKPTTAPKKSNEYAAVNIAGGNVLVTVKVKDIKKGKSAEKLLEDVEDENGASFGAIANKGYDIVVAKITVKLPSSMEGFTQDCIPDIRIRDAKGNLINGEAVYVYVGKLGDYNNSGLTKTYDVIFEIPEGTNTYMMQFGTYGEDNYNYIVK